MFTRKWGNIMDKMNKMDECIDADITGATKEICWVEAEDLELLSES